MKISIKIRRGTLMNIGEWLDYLQTYLFIYIRKTKLVIATSSGLKYGGELGR